MVTLLLIILTDSIVFPVTLNPKLVTGETKVLSITTGSESTTSIVFFYNSHFYIQWLITFYAVYCG